jgi:hypothetical protein
MPLYTHPPNRSTVFSNAGAQKKSTKMPPSPPNSVWQLCTLIFDGNPKGLPGADSTSQLDSTVACSFRERPFVIALVGFPSNAIVVAEIEQSMRVLLPTSLHSSVLWIVLLLRLPSVSLQPYASGSTVKYCTRLDGLTRS